ncbi:MAG TPA: hypothetical protein VFK96_10520 [Gammaproteobacteria bacterium]|nr:hypothetical protein [Gammaproteobacteria bacterium]
MSTINTISFPGQSSSLRAGLWLAQGLLAGVYLYTGIAALVLSTAQVSTIVPWASHVPGMLLTFFGPIDVIAGLGILLPSLMRTAPILSATTAACSAVLQVFAIFFYAVLGTLAATLPLNLAILVLSVFVAWGRSKAAPIAPRLQDRLMSSSDFFASERVDGSGGRPGISRRAMRRKKSSSNGGFPCQRGTRGTRSAGSWMSPSWNKAARTARRSRAGALFPAPGEKSSQDKNGPVPW